MARFKFALVAAVLASFFFGGVASADSFLTSPRVAQKVAKRTFRTANSALNFIKNNRSSRSRISTATMYGLVRQMNRHSEKEAFLTGLRKLTVKGPSGERARLLYHSIKLRNAYGKEVGYRLSKLQQLASSPRLKKSVSAQTLLGMSIAFADTMQNNWDVPTNLKIQAAGHLNTAVALIKAKVAAGASSSQQGGYMLKETKDYAQWYEGFNNLITE